VEAILSTDLAVLPSWRRAAQLETETREIDLSILRHAGPYASTGVPAYQRSSGRSSAVRPDGGVSARALNDEELATYRGCLQDDVDRLRELRAQLDECTRLGALVEEALKLVDAEIRIWLIRIYSHYPQALPVATLNLPWCRETFDLKLDEAMGTMARYFDGRVTETAFWRLAGLYPAIVTRNLQNTTKTRRKTLDFLVTIAV
jgi:hypothetical protein